MQVLSGATGTLIWDHEGVKNDQLGVALEVLREHRPERADRSAGEAPWVGLRHIPGVHRLAQRTPGLVLAPLAILGLLSGAARAGSDPAALALGDAMARWAATLDEEQRERALYWRWTPIERSTLQETNLRREC